ncbi:MAG: chemotaxis protein CheW [Lachnospiraceae bacterium]|nr:chemotaxis protein CheW [Lachnospiraceae bacterium]MBR3684480.1 chemotaxis protein CheW [Lachnospiraceae bacterium]
MEELRTDSEIMQFIVIKIGPEQFGIDIKYVDNIVRMQNITRVPKVQDYLKGVINLRGEVLPVVSLRLKMELEADEYTRATRIIILKVDGYEKTGIIVDEVMEVLTIDSSQIDKMTYDANSDIKVNYVNGICKVGDNLISLLDLNVVLTDRENA